MTELELIKKSVARSIRKYSLHFIDQDDASQGVCEIMLRRGSLNHQSTQRVFIDYLRTNFADPRTQSYEAQKNLVFTVDEAVGCVHSMSLVEDRMTLASLLKHLTKRKQDFVLDWLYGFSGLELAHKYNVCESRVSRFKDEITQDLINLETIR